MVKNRDFSKGTLRISKDWQVFSLKLADVLSGMTEDQMLTVFEKHSGRFVQFAAQGSWGMRAEISSNHYLSGDDQLRGAQIAQLVMAGWGAPTGNPADSTPESNPDGSPNFFIDFPAPLKTEFIARQAVTALSEILEIPHPGNLEYQGYDTDGSALMVPGLGVKHREKAETTQPEKIEKRVLTALKEITEIKDLEYDKDGDIGLRFRDLTLYVCVLGKPPVIRFYAPLMREVRVTHRLLSRLNELNSGLGFMHFFVREGTILAIAEIAASPFQYASLEQTMGMFSKIADDNSKVLQAEFGGKVTTPRFAQSAMVH